MFKNTINKYLKCIFLVFICLIPSFQSLAQVNSNSNEISPIAESSIIQPDFTVNNINYLNRRYPTLDGYNMVVGIKDDNYDSFDIDIKNRVLPSEIASPVKSIHSTEMATIIGGNGISSPNSLGVAKKVQFINSDFRNLYADPINFIQKNKIYVQNHSYGTIPENFYGAAAFSYDQQVYNYPFITHIFSAGNPEKLKDTSSIYSNINGFANLTGNYKMAKNIITVSAIDSLKRPLNAVSRGPAFDGRLKPEMTAYSISGSSGAAALVSGTAILLNQAYQQMTGKIPRSDLVKALLLNSADDVAGVGIDYKTGYGSLNAEKAVEQILSGQYFFGTIDDVTFEKTSEITVPQNSSNLKILLYWIDPPAKENAPLALVNNLDLKVIDPGNNLILPWVLSSYPHFDSLNLKAKRGKDNLNNIEQITIENPLPGNYKLIIESSNSITTNQSFVVVYQWEPKKYFEWTYPTSNDNFPFLNSNKGYLRWKTNLEVPNNNGILEIRYDDNNSWKIINNSINLIDKQYLFFLPDDFQGRAQFRMRTEIGEVLSESFIISQSIIPNIGFNCSDSLLIYWDKNKNDKSFNFYSVNDQGFKKVINTTDTFAIFKISDFKDQLFVIEPVFTNDQKGMKSKTFDLKDSEIGCYISNFSAISFNDSVLIELEVGSNYKIDKVIFFREDNGIFKEINTQTSTTSLKYHFNDYPNNSGYINYQSKIVFNNGNEIYTEIIKVYSFTKKERFVLFPNPINRGNTLNIFSTFVLVGDVSISIFDLHGKVILEKKLISNYDMVPLINFLPGIYFYRLKHNDFRKIGKLIID